MNRSNDAASPNPYQPPVDLEQSHELKIQTVALTSLPFSGAALPGDLNEFLDCYDSISWSTVAGAFIFLSLLQLWSIMMGGGFAIMVAGGVLLVALMVITSTRTYRSLVFRSMNPHWYDRVDGELTAEGIRIQRPFETCLYRWNWFAGVVIAEHMVGFVPAMKSDNPILIGESMLPASVSLEQLKRFARSARVICQRQSEGTSVYWAIKQVMKTADRERQVDVPAEAVTFQGFIRGVDIKSLPQSIRRPERPRRAQVVRGFVLLGTSAIAVGALLIFIQLGLGPVGLILSIVVGAVVVMVFQRSIPTPAPIRDDHVLAYQIGFADAAGVVTDYFVTVNEIPWSSMWLIDQSPSRLLLGQQSSRRVLIANREMFTSTADWQRFVDLATTQTGRPSDPNAD